MPEDLDLEKPPYLSLTTLNHFFDRWGEGPVPPRIDKSALDKYSGGTQAVLMSTLRLMSLVDGDGVVLPALRSAVASEADRKAILREWASQFYAEQVQLAEQNATAQMLHESFAKYGYSGSTLRKAVVFYLQLVEYVGLPNSPLFRAPKQSVTSSTKRRPRAAAPMAPATGTAHGHELQSPAAPKGETTVVHINGLATITVIVDAQWMKLPVETITSMRKAIAELEALDTGAPAQP